MAYSGSYEIDAAEFLIKAISKAMENCDAQLKPIVNEIGNEILNNLKQLIWKTREPW
jgi:hypothetical protein